MIDGHTPKNVQDKLKKCEHLMNPIWVTKALKRPLKWPYIWC